MHLNDFCVLIYKQKGCLTFCKIWFLQTRRWLGSYFSLLFYLTINWCSLATAQNNWPRIFPKRITLTLEGSLNCTSFINIKRLGSYWSMFSAKISVSNLWICLLNKYINNTAKKDALQCITEVTTVTELFSKAFTTTEFSKKDQKVG